MEKKIIKALKDLEAERNIKIIYAVESGSRAWGFESVNSDWDVRFFYIHNLDWYLSIGDKKDTIELNLPGDLDLSGWDFRKTLKLFSKSNFPLLEWLKSPIIYLDDGFTAGKLRELEKEYFYAKSCIYHYLSIAKGTYKDYFQDEYVKIKKYFYVLRPLLACEWVKNREEPPPVEFERLVEGEISSELLKSEIKELVNRKKQGEELDFQKKPQEITNYIIEKLDFYNNYVNTLPEKTGISHLNKLNELFKLTLANSWK